VISLAPIARAGPSAAMMRTGMRVWGARWSASSVSVVYATALLIVAVSYSASRTEASWAQPVFWAGFFALLLPSVVLLASSSGSRNHSPSASGSSASRGSATSTRHIRLVGYATYLVGMIVGMVLMLVSLTWEAVHEAFERLPSWRRRVTSVARSRANNLWLGSER
jgi:hypothetical protein